MFPNALLLNADYRPLSFYPLSTLSWEDAIKGVHLGKHSVVDEYPDIKIRSPSVEMRLPSVVALRQYVQPSKHVAFTRHNLFLRDGYQCQYCGATNELTFDHLVPRCRGGKTTWANVVTCCATCNMKKGHLAHHHFGKPKQMPFKPTIGFLERQQRKFPPRSPHDSWRAWLWLDAELEP